MPISFLPAFITLIDTDLESRLDIGSFFTITSMGQLIETLLFSIIAMASLVFLAYLGWASIRWLTAGGDKAQLETARSRVTQAFIGLSLVAATWAIFSLAVYALGLPFDLLQGTGNPTPPPGATPTPPPGATPTPPTGCGCSVSFDPGSRTQTINTDSTFTLNTNCNAGASAQLASFFSDNLTIANVSPSSINNPPFQTTVTCNSAGTTDINAAVEIHGCPPQTTVQNSSSTVTCVPCTPTHTSPADGTHFFPQDVTITWASCPSPISWYLLETNTTIGGTTTTNTRMVNGTSFTYAGLVGGATVRWSLQSCTSPNINTCSGLSSSPWEFVIDIPPTPTPIPYWIFNTQALCPDLSPWDGDTQMYTALWPPTGGPDWAWDSPAPGIHTMSVTPTDFDFQNVYVGLDHPDADLDWLEPFRITPNDPDVSFGHWFNPPTWMITVDTSDLPSGTYTIDYLAPAGACGLIPNGGSCTRSGDCESGFCSNDQDNDGDGYYGSYTSGTGTCQDGPADCRDNRTLVHPNQFNYFETAIPGYPGDFNYDCADSDGDGNVNDQWPRINCLSQAPQSTTCEASPLPASTYQPQTGWDTTIPICGSDLMPNRFWLCTASHLDNCGASPAVAETFSCSDGCVTGNSCDWGVDQACISWRMDDWLPFSTYLGGITRMPCK